MTVVPPVTAPSTHPASAPPRHSRSQAYRSQAGRYDQRTDAFRSWRELLVEHLPIQRGDTVLDVGCGTGLCLPLLQGQGRSHRDHHRNRRVPSRCSTVAAANASPRQQLGQCPPRRGPCRHRTDGHHGRRRPVLRRARRHAIGHRTAQHRGSPAARRSGGGGRRQTARTLDVAPASVGRDPPRPFITTSPASTGRGSNSRPTSPTSGSTNSPSAPGTSRSATPETEQHNHSGAGQRTGRPFGSGAGQGFGAGAGGGRRATVRYRTRSRRRGRCSGRWVVSWNERRGPCRRGRRGLARRRRTT